MTINTNLKNFKKQHIKKNNQIIYHSEKFKNKFIIENLIDNFLKKKNSFVFESVEKGKIRGRYTIFGADPDKIWEFNKNKVFYLKNNKKTKTLAITHYTVLDTNNNYSLLKLNPETGKKHQLRKQLLIQGNPILGDTKYRISNNYENKKNSYCFNFFFFSKLFLS